METLYKNGAHRDFKSYRQWQREGFQVKKGEKPFMLWARPKDVELLNEEAQETEIIKFFPIAYLFSNAQVESIDNTEPEPSAEPPKPELEPLPYG